MAEPRGLSERVPELHTSRRQLKDDEPCWRQPAAVTAPSLSCRWYWWKQSESAGSRPSAGPELMAPSALCLLLTAAVLVQKGTLSRWVKLTSPPSLVCGAIITRVDTNHSRCTLKSAVGSSQLLINQSELGLIDILFLFTLLSRPRCCHNASASVL